MSRNTILNELMTAWEGDLWEWISSSGIDNYCRLKKIVCKNLQMFLENVKSFSERFFEAVRLSLYKPQIRKR